MDKPFTKYIILAELIKPDFLVTGDKDLLVLKNVQETRIIRPSEFVGYL